MSNETMKDFIDMLVNDIINGDIDAYHIDPHTYQCLRGITIPQMRKLIKPHGLDLAYLKQGIVDTHNWYFYRHGAEDVTGWRQYADESI